MIVGNESAGMGEVHESAYRMAIGQTLTFRSLHAKRLADITDTVPPMKGLFVSSVYYIVKFHYG